MNDPTAKATGEWPGFAEPADLITFHIGAWNEFGYANPPAPNCKTIPPLGERSAEAIKAGHAAVRDIDELVRELYQLREVLIGEMRADEDVRACRVDAMLAEARTSKKKQTARDSDTFKCCDTPMPWPTRTEDRVCLDCGTVWEHDGVDLGAGARIKSQPGAAPDTARCGSPATCAEFGHEHPHIDDAVHSSSLPEPTPLIHMERSASATVCGLPTWKPPLHLGVLTVDVTRVTCPACLPKKYWQEPDTAPGIDPLTTPATGLASSESTAAEPPHQPSIRAALKDELGRLRREREAWEETARACVCPPGLCTRGEFRDHAGEAEGCMVCADLDPDQPCYAAVVRGLREREGAGR